MNVGIEMETTILGSRPIFVDHVKYLILDSVEFVNIKNCRFVLRPYKE